MDDGYVKIVILLYNYTDKSVHVGIFRTLNKNELKLA